MKVKAARTEFAPGPEARRGVQRVGQAHLGLRHHAEVVVRALRQPRGLGWDEWLFGILLYLGLKIENMRFKIQKHLLKKV